MTITIRLTKVEVEMLKELQKRDKRYKKGLESKIKAEINHDYLTINQPLTLKFPHSSSLSRKLEILSSIAD